MNRHIASVHEGKKPFKCDTCDARFALMHHLKSHIASVHEKKRFNCAKCDASFTQKGHLNIHIKTVHEENESISYKSSDA